MGSPSKFTRPRRVGEIPKTPQQKLRPSEIVLDEWRTLAHTLSMSNATDRFRKLMREIYPEDGYYDPEQSHESADDLLLETLERLGYGEGLKIFRDATRWYS